MSNQNNDMSEIKSLVNKVQDYAEKNKFAYLVPEQMLFILLSDDKCVKLIKSLTKDSDKRKTVSELKKEVSEYVENNVEKTDTISDINPTNSYTKLIQASVSQGAMRSISPDSLCVFIMLFEDKNTACSYFLNKHGICEEDVRNYISEYRNKNVLTSSQYLSKYSVNLIDMAKEGKIDPLIGREKEVERVIQVLAKKRSSCPILVGVAGCIESNTLIKVRKIS